MKTILYETGAGALDTLLGTNVFVCADLYTYTLADGSTTLRYTTADIDITYSGSTWSSKTVHHNTADHKTTGHWKVGLDVDTWTVTATPRETDPVTAAAYPDKISGQPWLSAVRGGALDGATVRIDRAYMAAWPTAAATFGLFVPVGIITIFTGRVASIECNRLSATLTLHDMCELLTMTMPRHFYQAGCRHVLFDSACSLTAASFKVSTAATAGSTRTSLLSTAVPPSAPGSGTFTLGRVKMTSGNNSGAQRLVKSWTSGTFTLMSPLPYDVTNGDTFDAFPGCDKKLTTTTGCTGFANTLNFGGQPFIPTPETAA